MLCRVQELCESRGGRPGLPVPNSPYGLCGRKATLNLILMNLILMLFPKELVMAEDIPHITVQCFKIILT